MTTQRISLSERQVEDLLNEEVVGHGIPRRSFLKRTGFFLVGFSLAGCTRGAEPKTGSADFGQLDPTQLDSWLAISQDGNVTLFFGKVDNGQGVFTAFRQLVTDELDVSFDRVQVIAGDTALTIDLGGASGSDGINGGYPTVRQACAEARQVMLELASKRLGVSVEQLTVGDGVIRSSSDLSKSVSYGELIGGQRLNTTLQWNGEMGKALTVEGAAQPKSVDQYRAVGQSMPREDIPAVVFGQEHFVADVRLPGMLHGRSIRPPVAGSRLGRVDESSISDLPGVVKVVNQGDYVGVVCEREEQAIQASQRLKVTWSEPSEPPFATDVDGLYEYIRQAPSRFDEVAEEVGNVDEALGRAARIVEATYEWPFQSHSSFGPGCAVADWQNGELTVWTGTQKPYSSRRGLASFFGLPQEKVRVIWRKGPGSYGRNDAGDVAFEAALLAKEIGRPVRLQWMRHEGTAWDPKGPALVMRLRGGLDAAGSVIAWDFEARGFSQQDVSSRESSPGATLVGQLLGFERVISNRLGIPSGPDTCPNRRQTRQVIHPLLEMGSPLRTAHLRLPSGPHSTFGGESFIDELAEAVGADPVQFRLRYLTDERQVHALKSAAEAAAWQTRPSPRPGARASGSGVVTGRGIAVRREIATVAEVEVNLETGKVRVKRFVCAHDCGLIFNPDGLRNTIEGNLLHSMSRALYEEVKFDRSRVTSVDWRTYPIATMADTPDQIDLILINRPDLPPEGAGEPSSAHTAAAIGNAIFDATGVRLRRVPFTAERVKAALNAQS